MLPHIVVFPNKNSTSLSEIFRKSHWKSVFYHGLSPPFREFADWRSRFGFQSLRYNLLSYATNRSHIGCFLALPSLVEESSSEMENLCPAYQIIRQLLLFSASYLLPGIPGRKRNLCHHPIRYVRTQVWYVILHHPLPRFRYQNSNFSTSVSAVLLPNISFPRLFPIKCVFFIQAFQAKASYVAWCASRMASRKWIALCTCSIFCKIN